MIDKQDVIEANILQDKSQEAERHVSQQQSSLMFLETPKYNLSKRRKQSQNTLKKMMLIKL